MARLPRLDLPNLPQHIVQRGNNRQTIFFHDEDYAAYLSYLREALAKNNCKLYAYVLMTNHVHLLVAGGEAGAVSGLMQSVGRRYVHSINKTYRRTGTLFEGRFKSSLIESEYYLLACMRYIELNPVRANMVRNPGDYRWSSYGHHAGDLILDWLDEPEEYRRMGATNETRAQAYIDLFKVPVAHHELEAIRTHLNKDCALGSSKFQDEIEAALGRRAKILPMGRPRKSKISE